MAPSTDPDPALADLDPSSIDAVVLDAGGVLVLPHPDPIRVALEEARGLSAVGEEDVWRRAHYAAMYAWDHHGSNDDWRSYQRAYLLALGFAHDVTEADDVFDHLDRAFVRPSRELWIWVIEDTRRALGRLAGAGVPLAVVSNADGHVAEALAHAEVVQVGPGPGIEVVTVVDSGVVGCAKPDPRIFDHALEPLGLPPERCVYIGDSVVNDVGGATAAGLVPLLLDPHGLHEATPHRRIRSVHEVADHLGAP